MKKLISVFLCALMVFSTAFFTASAEETDLSVIVVNDLHLDLKDATAEKVAKRNSLSEVYAHASSGGQLPYESVALIKAFLRDAAALESEIVIMPGDLTTVGSVDEHTAFISLIKEFEETTGKKVFVVPGNHDYYGKLSVSEIEALYADFGYGEAIAAHEATASYVAELGNGYRLLAIDSCTPRAGGHGVDSDLEGWVKAQCEKAKADGKKMIAMAHHNLVEHFPLEATIHKGSVINDGSNTLADTLADNGVKIIFTAHTHDHDIEKYTSKNGNVIYDSVTTALNAYPCSYREVKFGEKIDIKTKNVRSIDTSLLPEGIHEEAMALANSNFLIYAKNCTYLGIRATIGSYLKPAAIKNLLKTDNEELQEILYPAIDKAGEVIALPLYKADEEEEGKSIEAMAEAMGTTLPATDHKYLVDIVVEIYQAHAEGDENYPGYKDEMIVFQRALAVILNYALADLTAEQFTFVLGFLAETLGAELPDELISFVGGTLEKTKGSEMFVTAVLLPLVTQFSVDEAPADNNVTLPGYGAPKSEDSGDFLTMIKDFFKKIFDFFHMLFALIA